MSLWTCDGCGKVGPWAKGWTYFPGVDSAANLTAEGKPAPLVACSEACADVALARAGRRS